MTLTARTMSREGIEIEQRLTIHQQAGKNRSGEALGCFSGKVLKLAYSPSTRSGLFGGRLTHNKQQNEYNGGHDVN